jgi:hypothetical protein
MMNSNKTQLEMVLTHLMKGKAITPIEALERFGVFRLAAIVHSLRKEGYQIATDLIGKGRNKYAKYTLEV